MKLNDLIKQLQALQKPKYNPEVKIADYDYDVSGTIDRLDADKDGLTIVVDVEMG